MKSSTEGRLRVLHAIHDFLPRHRAGSEIYAAALCRALSARHHVSVLCADYDPSRAHGQLVWRVHEGLPVIEVVNNWVCDTFADTYRSPLISERIDQVLQAVQPDVVHVHNLLNLSFDLPAAAHARGIPVVATLHDYTLVCPSGGQRLHRADWHVCHDIEPDRCARCFRESDFYTQAAVGPAAAAVAESSALQRVVGMASAVSPALVHTAARVARRARGFPVTAGDIAERLAAARRVFEQVDLFVAPSPSMAAEFQTLGLDHARVRVSDYGFSALPPGRRTSPRGRLRIGFVGTLVWHKGAHILLAAVRQLPSDAYEVLLNGDVSVFPDYVAGLRRQAEGLPVRFMGGFEADRTGEVYAQMDILVVPSLWLENSPLVVHEAFMSGVPVIGARMGGIADLIKDGVSGRLYDARSPSALAEILRAVIADPGQLRAWASVQPPVKSMAEDAVGWERTYHDLVQQRPRTGNGHA